VRKSLQGIVGWPAGRPYIEKQRYTRTQKGEGLGFVPKNKKGLDGNRQAKAVSA